MNKKQIKGLILIGAGILALPILRYFFYFIGALIHFPQITFLGLIIALGLIIIGVLQLIGKFNIDNYINKDNNIENILTDNSTFKNQIMNTDNQNKVVNITLNGGIIGAWSDSPHNALNRRIKTENTNGWRVVQVIPSDSGNIVLAIFRILLLIVTAFLYTTANGYYVIMEKK